MVFITVILMLFFWCWQFVWCKYRTKYLSPGFFFFVFWQYRLLFRSAYYFGSGPFHRFWIRKGYDPRNDPESRMWELFLQSTSLLLLVVLTGSWTLKNLSSLPSFFCWAISHDMSSFLDQMKYEMKLAWFWQSFFQIMRYCYSS